MRLSHQSRKKYTRMDTMLFQGKANNKQISKREKKTTQALENSIE